jgi:TrmH RNA methyltransferase
MIRPVFPAAVVPVEKSVSDSERPARKSHRPAAPRRERGLRQGSKASSPESTPRFKRGDERRMEAKVYGFNACLTLFEKRPEQIVRGYFSDARAKSCGPVMKYLAAHKKAYHIVSEDELQRVSASTHHEGICLLIRRPPSVRIAEWCQRNRDVEPLLLVAVEGVSNPHNLGAILRTCAHYGVQAVAINDPAPLQSGAAVRTAEGGAEFVDVVEYKGVNELVRTAKKYDMSVLATSSHNGVDLFRAELPARAVLLLGEEARGLSRQVIESADLSLRIPGTGSVESLNVSAATAVILGEFWRQHHPA